MGLILIRHTAVAVGKGVCYGQQDVDLAETFPDEAERVRRRLPDVLPTLVYASPLTRCARLARVLVGKRDIPIHFDDRLKELHFGDWEGHRWDALDQERLNHWGDNYVKEGPPGGESYQVLFNRSVGLLQSIDKNLSPDETVWVVTHGGVIRAALSWWEKTPLERSFDRKIAYGDVFPLIKSL